MWASSGFEDSEYSRFEDWDFTYFINVKGTVIFAESVAEKMKERNYGKIINIASHAGKYASPSNPAYGASKASVVHLTQSFALRWASNNINVNVICPGSIWTPMWARIAERLRRQNVLKNKISIIAKDEAGLFYAFTSLDQLIEDSKDQNVNLPMVSIKDYPLLKFRPIHIDVKHHYPYS